MRSNRPSGYGYKRHALANTNTIDANGKWKFEAACLDDAAEIAEIRFKEISGF